MNLEQLLNNPEAQHIIEPLAMAYAEYMGLSQLWLDVIAKCGASIDIPVLPGLHLSKYIMAATAAYDSPTHENEIGRMLSYGLGISTTYTKAQLAGIMAHELAHFINGDIDTKTHTKEQEYAADAYAASHGFGADLADSLRVAYNALGDGAEDDPTNLHPPTMERISLLTGKPTKEIN